MPFFGRNAFNVGIYVYGCYMTICMSRELPFDHRKDSLLVDKIVDNF
jgi:hypothetical protein